MKTSTNSISASLRSIRFSARSTFGFHLIAAGCALAALCLPASAQTAYTWNGTTGGAGAWTASGSWTPAGVPGGNVGDTATITQTGTTTSAIELVTLGSSESIASLTFNQTSTGTIDLLLGSSTASLTLTNAGTLALGGNSTGTELLYLDGIDFTKNVNYAGNINVGSNGILELGASGHSSSAISAVTGTVQVQSGGILNIDRPIDSGNAGNVNITGSVSVASGGTLNLDSINSGSGTGATTAVVATGTTALRFNVNGSLTAASGSTINATTTGSQTLTVFITAANSGTLTFNSAAGTGGTFFNATNEANEAISFTGAAQTYSILSYNNLPAVSLLPSGTFTSSQPVNITLGTPNGTSALTIGNLNYAAPLTAASTYAGTLEVTLNSNLTLTGNLNASNHGSAGQSFIINTNGFTFDQSTYGALKTANVNSAAANWTYEGGGTLKATYFDLSVATGSNGSSVVGTTTLWASGTGTTNLGNATGGTIDPTSIFKYAGSGATTGSLTTTAGATNRAIGRVLVGDGTNASVLNLASNVTGQGDITVNAKSSFYLNGFNYTEASASTSNAGGLTSSGGTVTIANNGAGTATLTLDATHGAGNFGGANDVIEDHAAGTGTLVLALVGTGTQTLSSANTYSGGTVISGGNLAVTNSGTTTFATGTGTVTVGGQSGGQATATLSGTGAVAGLVTSSANSNVANITPGTAGTAGTLHVGTLGFTIGAGTNFNFDLASTTAGTSDLIAMSGGALTVGGSGIVFNFNQLGGSLSTTGSYTLISGAASSSGFVNSNFSATGIGSDTATFTSVGNNLYVSFGAGGTVTSTTYTLAATSNVSRMLSGSTATLTTTIRNTGSPGQDTLNYSGLGGSGSAGTVTGAATSGTALALGATATNTQQTFTSTTLGNNTITPTVSSATNTTIGGAATATGTTTATIDVVAERTFAVASPGSGTITLGRFLVTSAPAGTATVQSIGLNNVTANATLGSYSASNTDGLTLVLSSGTNTFTGSTPTQSTTYALGGTATTTGSITGSFTNTATDEFGNTIAGTTVGLTGDAIAKRVITNGATTNLGLLHSGATVSTMANAFSSTGSNATTTSVSVAGGNGSADSNGVTLSGSSTSFTGATAGSVNGSTQTFGGTIVNAAGGTTSGTFNLAATTLETGLGDTYAPVNVAYTATVYTGAGVWNTNGGGSWGTTPTATPANWTANGGIPGITPGFVTTDSASFGTVTSGGTATVTLNGASPYLNAITFNDNAASYNIAQGTGGTVHLDSTGTATITDTAGNHAISAPIELDGASATSVASSSTLTLSGNISENGSQALTIGGPGTTFLSGSNSYSGGTTVNSGATLFVGNGSGSATGSGALNVAAGATLGGAGLINASSFNIGGSGSRTNLIVGNGADTTSSLTLTGTGSNAINNVTLTFNISAAAPGQGNELSVGTSVIAFSGGSTLALNVAGVGIIPAYSPYVLIAGTGSNQYTGLTTQSEMIDGQTFNVITGGLNLSFAPSLANTWYANNSFLYLNTAGGVDDIEVEVVPEPGTWALMLGGLAALLLWQRARRRC